MTIKEIDNQGYVVKYLKQSSVPGRGIFSVVLLEKNHKYYVAWKPYGHTEYTTPFQIQQKTFPGVSMNNTLSMQGKFSDVLKTRTGVIKQRGVCIDCGEQTGRHHTADYCNPCAKKHNLEYSRNRAAENKRLKKLNK
jgi:hypothetical protein